MRGNALEVLKAELRPSEHLLWNGKPRQGILFVAADLLYIPFSLFWISLIAVWALPVFGKFWVGDTLVIALGAIGVHCLFGRFFINAFQRKCTHYGITNQRILVLSGIVRRSLSTIEFERFADMDFAEWDDGVGVISTNTIHPIWRGFVGGSWPFTRRGFPVILNWFDDVQFIFGLIREVSGNENGK